MAAILQENDLSVEQLRFVFEDALLMLHDRVDCPFGRFPQYGRLHRELDAALAHRNNLGKIFTHVRRQNIWRRSRRKLVESGPRLGIDIRRRAFGAASADIGWSVV